MLTEGTRRRQLDARDALPNGWATAPRSTQLACRARFCTGGAAPLFVTTALGSLLTAR